MKKIKIITGVLLIIVGMLVMISGLFNKKEQEVVVEQTTIGNKTQINNTTTTSSTTTTKKVKTTKKVVKTTKKTTKKITQKVTVNNTTKKTSGYRLTHYGWDCCKSGRTSTGYDIRKTVYYNDTTYGKVRIVAMCSKMPLYSIIKIKDYKLGGDTLAIVLDRGVGCGTIDLAVKNEKIASKYGIQNNVQIEILRKGR